MKEKIKKLFTGTREDMIIACNLLVNNYDPEEFLRQWRVNTEFYYGNNESQGLPYIRFIEDKPWRDDTSFYYHYSPNRFILCSRKFGVCIVGKVYRSNIEVINH